MTIPQEMNNYPGRDGQERGVALPEAKEKGMVREPKVTQSG
jgi:hypothetical protein